MPANLSDVVEHLLHRLGMHGPEAAYTLAVILVAAAFAGDWAGIMISTALRRRRVRARRPSPTFVEAAPEQQ